MYFQFGNKRKLLYFTVFQVMSAPSTLCSSSVTLQSKGITLHSCFVTLCCRVTLLVHRLIGLQFYQPAGAQGDILNCRVTPLEHRVLQVGAVGAVGWSKGQPCSSEGILYFVRLLGYSKEGKIQPIIDLTTQGSIEIFLRREPW